MKPIFLLSVLTIACTSSPSALEVIVEADLEVANRSRRVAFEVRTQEGQVALSEQFDLVETPFPIRRLVSPRGGDVSRVVTITAQALNAEGEALATARIIRSFVQGESVEVRLRLFELCLGIDCGEGLTCAPVNGRGTCVDARLIDVLGDGGLDSPANEDSAANDGGFDSAEPDSSACPGNQTSCSGTCVDLDNSEAHCGDCERTCSDGLLCQQGDCQVPAECDINNPSSCTGLTYCNPADNRYPRL